MVARFVNVGERCNVAGSRIFLRLINEKKTKKTEQELVREMYGDPNALSEKLVKFRMLNIKRPYKQQNSILNLIGLLT